MNIVSAFAENLLIIILSWEEASTMLQGEGIFPFLCPCNSPTLYHALVFILITWHDHRQESRT